MYLRQLMEHGLVPEKFGGETVTVNVSAKKRTGLDELLEMILLVADLQELKANPDKPATGVIIEAELSRGKGAVATALVSLALCARVILLLLAVNQVKCGRYLMIAGNALKLPAHQCLWKCWA